MVIKLALIFFGTEYNTTNIRDMNLWVMIHNKIKGKKAYYSLVKATTNFHR